MRKIKIEIISGILSAVMILSSLPVTVFADKNTDENTVPTVTSEIITSEPSTETEVVYEETETEPIDENVTSIPEDETGSSQVDLDEDIDPLIDETTETSEATEETTETSETTEAPAELIEFDHYYTEIDESVVNTSDLFVQTSDASVFTSNTNVVSNYDDVYIISCNSVEEARYVYSYYVGKVDNITDLANVISVASENNEDDVADLSNTNNGEDAIANLNEIDVNDYSGYIALIDTGANADVNFSVVGDNTTDSNGHGTAMLGYIREENPDARVMSIKVFDDSNTTNAANVYAGIKLAIESNVSIINLSLVGADIETNAIVKEVIQEAIDKGIIVIGAAGNYNLSATRYIPGCVNGVITVGAVNEDGTKYATSNYNADLYVIATSTSEAAARYSGIYTSGNSSDKVYSEYIIPTPTITPVPTSVEDNFEIADISWENSVNDLGIISAPNLANYAASGNDYGECLFSGDGSGIGTVSSFVSYGHAPDELTINDFGSDLRSVCARHWGEDESKGARAISGTNVRCWYESSYTITYNNSTSVYEVEFVIRLSQRPEMTQPQWTPAGGSINYTVSSDTNEVNLTQYSVNILGGPTLDTEYVYLPQAKQAIAEEIRSYITSYIVDMRDYSGNRNLTIDSDAIDISTGSTHSVSYSYETSSDTQVFRAQLTAQQVATVPDLPLDLTKVNSASAYNIMTQGNSCYNFAGTLYTLYADPACTQALFTYTFGSDGHTTGGIFSLPGTEVANEPTYFLRETAAGPGYYLDTTVYSVSFHADRTVTVSGGSNATVTISQSADANSPAEITLADEPMVDPFAFNIIKDDNVNDTSSTVPMDAVTFRIQYYAAEYAVTADLSGVAPTDDFYVTIPNTTNSATIFASLQLQQLAGADSSVTVTGDNDYLAAVYASGIQGWEPLGTYVIQESTAPTHYVVNPTVYRIRIYDEGNVAGRQIVNTTTNTDVTGRIVITNGLNELTTSWAEPHETWQYSCNKIITDTREQQNLAGFNFSIYWNNNGNMVLFATGVSQTDGRVYWTYELGEYYHLEADGQTRTLLTGTNTYNLELVAEATYEIREDAVTYSYGNQNSGLEYAPCVPVGWTAHTGSNGQTDYFYKSLTGTSGVPVSETVTNDWEESAGFSVYKTKPTGDLFDFSMVTFTAYTYVNGVRYDIATGTADANGNITWTRTDTSGYGIYQNGNYDNRTSVNSLVSLPCGTYYVEEAWDKMYVDALDAATQDAVEVFATNNTSGWATNDAGTEYISTITVDCTTPNTTTTVALNNPQNDWHYQWFSANKVVTVAGDASTIDFELYYNNGTDLVLFATGYAVTTGEGTFPIIWDGYQGPAEFIQNNGQGIVLPEGDYEIREIVPNTYYQNGADNVPYTYMVPTGWQDHLGANGHSDYFYTTFSAANDAETVINSINPVDTRIEAELTIRKVEESNSPSGTFTFAVYYRGNEDQAQNLGDFSDQYLLDTVTVTTTNGSGLTTLTKIPEGWYEIVEIDTNGWECVWMNSSTNTANGKLVHASSENKTVSQIVISDDIEMSGTVLAGVWATNVIRPELHTEATTAIGNVVEYSDEATITDRVFFSHLVVGLEYTVTGKLAVKKDYAEGEEVEYVKDANGNIVTASTTFTAEATEGYVDVTFEFDSRLYQGETLVAFETLTYKGVEYVTHADITDMDQTTYVSSIGTSATDANGNKTFQVTETATVIDVINYHNLEVGRTYLAEGILMDKSTGEALIVNGETVTASATFVPEAADGSVTVTFSFNASGLAGKTVVVFEKVYDISGTTTIDQDTGLIITDETAKILIATHEDINDEDQTIESSLLLHVKIAKADKDNVAYYLKNAEITIFNADGTIAYDVNGNPCVGITNENGEVEFNLVYDRENTYYAQETKAPAGYSINPEKFEITPTSDRESEGVCLIPVTILDTIIIIPPKTGDNMNFGLYIVLTVLSTCGLAGGCFYFFKRRKKKHNA